MVSGPFLVQLPKLQSKEKRPRGRRAINIIRITGWPGIEVILVAVENIPGPAKKSNHKVLGKVDMVFQFQVQVEEGLHLVELQEPVITHNPWDGHGAGVGPCKIYIEGFTGDPGRVQIPV